MTDQEWALGKAREKAGLAAAKARQGNIIEALHDIEVARQWFARAMGGEADTGLIQGGQI